MTDKIYYRTGYKHILSYFTSRPMSWLTAYETGKTVYSDNPGRLPKIGGADAALLIPAGFGWDGVTWFPDFKFLQRAGLFHDALYLLIREGVLSFDAVSLADHLFYCIAIEDGCPKWLAKALLKVLKMTNGKAATPGTGRKVLSAP